MITKFLQQKKLDGRLFAINYIFEPKYLERLSNVNNIG